MLIRYESNYLAHAEKKDHKYKWKKYVNGRWQYYYDDPRKTKEIGEYKDDKGNKVSVKRVSKRGDTRVSFDTISEEDYNKYIKKKESKKPWVSKEYLGEKAYNSKKNTWTSNNGTFNKSTTKAAQKKPSKEYLQEHEYNSKKNTWELKKTNSTVPKKTTSRTFTFDPKSGKTVPVKGETKKTKTKLRDKISDIGDDVKDAISNAGDTVKDMFGVDEKQRMEKAKKEYLESTGNAKSVNEANLRNAATKANVDYNSGKDNRYAKEVVIENSKKLAKQNVARKEYERSLKMYKSKPIAATDKISEVGRDVVDKGKSLVDKLLGKKKKKR